MAILIYSVAGGTRGMIDTIQDVKPLTLLKWLKALTTVLPGPGGVRLAVAVERPFLPAILSASVLV